MQTIWKYRIDIADAQDILMPLGSKILCVQEQPGVGLCLWAIVDPDKQRKVTRHLRMYGTGHPHARIDGTYIGTAQEMGGQLVWHVFEVE